MGRVANVLCAATLGLAALVCAPVVASAQDQLTRGAILVLNQDALINQTAYGSRIQQELEAALQALAAENRNIETQLTAEELELTDLRETLPADEFRALADDFDTRVSAIRAAQDAKNRDLQTQAEAARQRFFEDSVPLLLELVDERGGSVLLDSRTVLLSAGGVDITEVAIDLLDERLGNGGDAPLISIPGLQVPGAED